MIQVSASQFKTQCLHYMQLLQSDPTRIVITKHGKPVAELVRYREPRKKKPLFGCKRGSGEIRGDILAPVSSEWEVLSL